MQTVFNLCLQCEQAVANPPPLDVVIVPCGLCQQLPLSCTPRIFTAPNMHTLMAMRAHEAVDYPAHLRFVPIAEYLASLAAQQQVKVDRLAEARKAGAELPPHPVAPPKAQVVRKAKAGKVVAKEQQTIF